jgi:hypothetical protein
VLVGSDRVPRRGSPVRKLPTAVVAAEYMKLLLQELASLVGVLCVCVLFFFFCIAITILFEKLAHQNGEMK